jgi:hypothetical protein
MGGIWLEATQGFKPVSMRSVDGRNGGARLERDMWNYIKLLNILDLFKRLRIGS